jgi:Protein of unknown function (DUF1203)
VRTRPGQRRLSWRSLADTSGDSMSSSFQLIALPSEQFEPPVSRSDPDLEAVGARGMIVNHKPGTPCRVSLADADVGETVILLPFAHHDVSSPHRASGPIFVRGGARTASPAVGEVPVMFRHRLLSLRAYDATAMMVDETVVTGTDPEDAIQRLFDDPGTSYLHVHNARPGCYNCSVVRA